MRASGFVLAIVPVGENGFAHQPVYVRRPFDRAPDPDACATNLLKLDKLMPRGTYTMLRGIRKLVEGLAIPLEAATKMSAPPRASLEI